MICTQFCWSFSILVLTVDQIYCCKLFGSLGSCSLGSLAQHTTPLEHGIRARNLLCQSRQRPGGHKAMPSMGPQLHFHLTTCIHHSWPLQHTPFVQTSEYLKQ